MSEKLIIKRDWVDPVIKLRVDANQISIETTVAEFERQVVARMLSQLPNLAWDFRKVTIHGKVEAAFRDAFAATVSELKKETIQVM